MTKASLKSCLKHYILLGWTSYIPDVCKNNILVIPSNIAPFIWGWPTKFLTRMKQVNTQVYLMDPYTSGSRLKGISTSVAKKLINSGYKGGIWTDDIDEF